MLVQEEFEDSTGAIRILKSKKDRQHSGNKDKQRSRFMTTLNVTSSSNPWLSSFLDSKTLFQRFSEWKHKHKNITTPSFLLVHDLSLDILYIVTCRCH